MRQGLTYKFCQDETLFKLLLDTGNAYLIYANPEDGFWGIGCTEEAAISGRVPSTHWGQNLLGQLLMELRNQLRTTGRPEWGWVIQPVAEVSLNRKRALDEQQPVAVATAVEPEVIVKVDESPLAPVQEQIAIIEAVQRHGLHIPPEV